MPKAEVTKKIAILGTRGLPASYGGFETFADEISHRLVEQGFEVTVFCEASQEVQPAKYGEVNLKYAPARKLGPLTTIAYDLASLWRARKGFDVVYMLGYGASIFCFLPRLWGTDVWINMDGLEWRRRKWNFLARFYLHLMEGIATRMPTRIVADARAIRSDLKERYTIHKPCDVIPYGCTVLTEAPDTDALTQRGLTAAEYYLVVCRFEPENHVAEIIDGFLSAHSSRTLVLIGNDKASTPYVTELRKRKDPKVQFIGPLYDRRQLRSLRFHCRAFFHGYSVGGTPLSLLEAMGCSNLVVAHDNKFNREVLGNGALYFGSPDDLSQIIQEIESKAIDEQSLKEKTKFRALEFYNWPLITAAYADLLNSSGNGTRIEVDVAPGVTERVD
jgi:glycosyltransferase involved in cell wall biosynthesis